MEKQTFTAVYPQQMRPSRYDGAHFLCYLNESPAEYKADEDAEPVAGFAYTGPMTDGGTLVECDEWERNKLINAVLRTRYLQTEEDAVKTHRLQLLETVKGKFMLTMFPFEMIDRYAQRNGWIIHRVERTISASKTGRRKQEEWMVCNYEERPQASLFDEGM